MGESTALEVQEDRLVALGLGLQSKYDCANLERVEDVYGRLREVSTTLAGRFSNILRKQESQFMVAFETQMGKAQEKVDELTIKLQSTDEKMKRELRMKELEEKSSWLSAEAFRLHSLVSKLQSQVQTLQEKNTSLQEDKVWAETQVKKAKKQNNILKDELKAYMAALPSNKKSDISLSHAGLLTFENSQLGSPTASEADRVPTLCSDARTLTRVVSAQTGELGKPRDNRLEDRRPSTSHNCSRNFNQGDDNLRLRQRIIDLQRKLNKRKSKVSDEKKAVIDKECEYNDLLDIFKECVKEAKKEVHRRVVRTRLEHRKSSILGSQYIEDMIGVKKREGKELTSLDKRKVIAKFFMQDPVFNMVEKALFGNQVKEISFDKRNRSGVFSMKSRKDILPSVRKKRIC